MFDWDICTLYVQGNLMAIKKPYRYLNRILSLHSQSKYLPHNLWIACMQWKSILRCIWSTTKNIQFWVPTKKIKLSNRIQVLPVDIHNLIGHRSTYTPTNNKKPQSLALLSMHFKYQAAHKGKCLIHPRHPFLRGRKSPSKNSLQRAPTRANIFHRPIKKSRAKTRTRAPRATAAALHPRFPRKRGGFFAE